MWVDGVVVTHQLKEYIEGPWFKPKSIHCFCLNSQIALTREVWKVSAET